MPLVVLDSHSKWLEVELMKSTTAERTVEVLRTMFSRFGLPRELVSDNGLQFTASTFAKCMQENGIRHRRSAPYHPATNGAAERVIQTLKRSLRTERQAGNGPPLQQLVARFLLSYRTTPHSTTGRTPYV